MWHSLCGMLAEKAETAPPAVLLQVKDDKAALRDILRDRSNHPRIRSTQRRLATLWLRQGVEK